MNTIIVHATLIALLVGISCFHLARGLEYFSCSAPASSVVQDLRSRPATFPGDKPSVYSSLPAQSRKDGSWHYFAKYQSACLDGGKRADKHGKRDTSQCVNCYITPHNQRYCYWG